MKTSTLFATMAVGGAIAYQILSKDRRARFSSAIERRMMQHMDQAMERLPDDAPPNLVRKVIPKLEAQTEEILELLREQNKLLRNREKVAR